MKPCSLTELVVAGIVVGLIGGVALGSAAAGLIWLAFA